MVSSGARPGVRSNLGPAPNPMDDDSAGARPECSGADRAGGEGSESGTAAGAYLAQLGSVQPVAGSSVPARAAVPPSKQPPEGEGFQNSGSAWKRGIPGHESEFHAAARVTCGCKNSVPPANQVIREDDPSFWHPTRLCADHRQGSSAARSRGTPHRSCLQPFTSRWRSCSRDAQMTPDDDQPAPHARPHPSREATGTTHAANDSLTWPPDAPHHEHAGVRHYFRPVSSALRAVRAMPRVRSRVTRKAASSGSGLPPASPLCRQG
jgi:hypothetical protein